MSVSLCMITPAASRLLAAAAAVSLAGHADPPVFRSERLADGVFMVAPTTRPGFGNDPNSLVVVGDRNVLVVDAQFSATSTRAVIAEVARLTKLPVRWLVNTHAHDDHISGNAEWKRAFPGVTIIGHRQMRAEMLGEGAKNRAGFLKNIPATSQFLRDLASKGRGIDGAPTDSAEVQAFRDYADLIERFAADSGRVEPTPPDTTFADTLEPHVGRHRVVLRFLGRAHTAGDIVADLPEEGITAIGDLLAWPVPLVGTTSYPREYGATLDRLEALGRRRLVPGHGPVLSDGAYLTEVRRLVESIAHQVDSMRIAGDSLGVIRKAVRLDEFRRLFAGEDRLKNEVFTNYVVQSAIPKAFSDGKNYP